MMKKENDDQTVKRLDITKGASPKQLLEVLKSRKAILIARGKKIEIEGDQIRIMMEKQLQIENIPDLINGIELTSVHKKMLMDGREVFLGDQVVRLDEEKRVLKIERPNDRKNGLKIG